MSNTTHTSPIEAYVANRIYELEAHVANRIRELEAQVNRLKEERDAARRKISDASAIMCDWDGFFDPKTQSGNTVELAKLIEEAYRILNSKEDGK